MRNVNAQEQDLLLQVLERHQDQLRQLPGVHYVDVGFKYVDGQPTDQLAIRVHVHEKLPESQLESSAVAPTEIEGIPVDVLQTNPEQQQNRNARFDPLVGGIATTNSTRLAGFVGTLGAVVFDRPSGAAMALSNHHVYVGSAGRQGDNIAQPSTTNANDVIGTLTRWNQRLDCAVGTLNNTRGVSTNILGRTGGVSVLQHPVIGMAVTKSGRTTGVTFGIVDGVSADEFTIVPDPNRPPPNGEISMGGDSGSLWVRTGATDAGIGLHFAGETDTNPANERAWAKRLINVAQALNIRFRRLPASPIARGNDMQPGEVLNPGDAITSANGRYRFVYQGDGNLVLYDGSTPLWASGTNGKPVGVCIMQGDGNLVIYDPDIALWSSKTHGNPGCRLVVQDDGNVVIYRPDNRPVWSTNTWIPGGPTASGDDMQPGEVLNPGNAITSANGRYRFVYQGDGNLVLYDGSTPLWASGTNGKPVGVCIMQGDGNLVIYKRGGAALWASGSWGNPGSRLVVQNDGNVVIYRPDNHPVWSTNTWIPGGPTATGDDMQPGEVLNPGNTITSANGRYRFVYQGDGNLVLCDGSTPLWASATNGKPVGVCIMQGDGNLVIYRRGGVALWASGTWGNPGSRLVAQNDGNVVIYRPDNHPVWATNTVREAAPLATAAATRQGDGSMPSA